MLVKQMRDMKSSNDGQSSVEAKGEGSSFHQAVDVFHLFLSKNGIKFEEYSSFFG